MSTVTRPGDVFSGVLDHALPAPPDGASDGTVDDVREEIEVGVLLPNGRLAGRRFASRAEAEAWARPDEGEQVVEFSPVCECAV